MRSADKRPKGKNDKWRTRRRMRIVDVRDFRCVGCRRKHAAKRALHLHHVMPSAKLFELSKAIGGSVRRKNPPHLTVTNDMFDSELAKTLPLCERCHDEVHARARELVERHDLEDPAAVDAAHVIGLAVVMQRYTLKRETVPEIVGVLLEGAAQGG